MRYHIDIIKQEIIDEETITFDEKLLLEIREELAQMPDQTQKVITRVFMQDMKYQEVADDLHISINTVKTLLRNGIKHLQFPLLSTPRTLNFLSPKSDTINRLSVLLPFYLLNI